MELPEELSFLSILYSGRETLCLVTGRRRNFDPSYPPSLLTRPRLSWRTRGPSSTSERLARMERLQYFLPLPWESRKVGMSPSTAMGIRSSSNEMWEEMSEWTTLRENALKNTEHNLQWFCSTQEQSFKWCQYLMSYNLSIFTDCIISREDDFERQMARRSGEDLVPGDWGRFETFWWWLWSYSGWLQRKSWRDDFKLQVRLAKSSFGFYLL